MKLPNAQKAIVDEKKVREYLLSPSHPVGRFKAKFFGSIGFPPEAWSPFLKALQRLAEEGEACCLTIANTGGNTLFVGKYLVRAHGPQRSIRSGLSEQGMTHHGL
jgi:hypothetical protein